MLAGVALEEMFGRGFTTVRDAGGADVGFRRAIEQGAINGPRLLPSGRPFTQTGGHGDQRSGPDFSGRRWDEHVGLVHVVADGPDEVRWAAREELRRGADQIKVMASGGVASPTDRLESVQHSLEELSSAVAAAQAVGTYVLAHRVHAGVHCRVRRGGCPLDRARQAARRADGQANGRERHFPRAYPRHVRKAP